MWFTINKHENDNGDILILHDNIVIQAFTYERNKDYRDTYIENTKYNETGKDLMLEAWTPPNHNYI